MPAPKAQRHSQAARVWGASREQEERPRAGVAVLCLEPKEVAAALLVQEGRDAVITKSHGAWAACAAGQATACPEKIVRTYKKKLTEKLS